MERADKMEQKVVKGRSLGQETWHRLKKNKGAVLGMIFLTVLFLAAIFSGVLYDYDSDIIALTSDRLLPPSLSHPFGTDDLGRDVFARVLYGSRYSLAIGMGSVAIGLVFGLIIGAVAGFYGGIVDQVLMRSNDILYAIPNIMIAVVVVSLLGTSTLNLLLALSISVSSGLSRICRASVMTVRNQEYIESGYAMGLPTWKIIMQHVIPNCLSPIIVQVTLAIGSSIISASSLSFLGIGIAAPAPEWGAMLSAGRGHIRDAGWMCIFPGLAIMFSVLALNLLGDGLRDALDPKLKR